MLFPSVYAGHLYALQCILVSGLLLLLRKNEIFANAEITITMNLFIRTRHAAPLPVFASSQTILSGLPSLPESSHL